eukprot:SAG31_NODE_37434_length_304_cov_0.814634_1_plen_70_part_01
MLIWLIRVNLYSGVCEGDNACLDCIGIPNGPNVYDRCGVCNDDAEDDCTLDCTGVYGGTAVLDDCGVCEG